MDDHDLELLADAKDMRWCAECDAPKQDCKCNADDQPSQKIIDDVKRR